MFHIIRNVCTLAHEIVARHRPHGGRVAIDATLGNGADTDFLAERFSRVYAFDLQDTAVQNYRIRAPENVTLILDSHHRMAHYVCQQVDCIMFNLGYLPGGEKSQVTQPQTTLAAIDIGLELIIPGGLMSIAVYSGHPGGKLERDLVLAHAARLPRHEYAVLLHQFWNRSETAPVLLIIEKRN